MRAAQKLIRKIKQADTPFYSGIKRMLLSVMRMRLPVPRFLLPVLRLLYHVHLRAVDLVRRTIVFFYREPLFRARCESVGKGLYLEQLPEISGAVQIRIGKAVTISGKLGIQSGWTLENPELIIGDGVFIGHQVSLVVGRRIVLEDGAAIAGGCFIADNDGHHRKIAGVPAPPEEIQEVRICRNAWIGRGSTVMKGVTVGENSIVGAGSVVMTTIPPNCIAMGNPARVVKGKAPDV